MTMHSDPTTGEILSPDDIVERAREIDGQIAAVDEKIDEVSEALKALKSSREKLVRDLRATVRPVPLFDQAPVVPEGARVTMRLSDQPKDAEVDITDALNAAGRKRRH